MFKRRDMKRVFCIIVISLFLIGACITEEILVKNTLSKINDMGNELLLLAQSETNLNNDLILNKTRNLNEFWLKYEDALCFFVNHKDMHEMGNEIIKMISYAKNNIKEEYTTSLELVIYYSDTFHHIMGVSLENIF